MSLAVFVAEGPNDVEIPALIFPSLEKGLEECIKLFGDKYSSKTVSDKVRYRWMLTKENDISKETAEKLFTSYYSGCGECYAGHLIEIEEGKPFVGWNLD